MIRDFFTNKLTRKRLDPFIARHAGSKRTLDIGCANSPYAELFPNRVGFDIEEGKNVDVVGDAHSLPFADGEFEQVLCTEVLEHLTNPPLALKEMRRVLAPGGTLILTTRFLFPLHDVPGDYFRYTKYGLQHLLKDWTIESLEEEVSTMETFGVLMQRVALQADLRGGAITKAFFILLGRMLGSLQFLVRQEYGMKSNRGKREETTIMTSGYYVVAKKSAALANSAGE